jgi:predicted CoA-binding protein
LVSLGYQTSNLEDLDTIFPGATLIFAVQWVGALFTIFSLLEEIHQGTIKIGKIVQSLKAYVYLDQAPVQLVDIHDGLDNTLIVLRSKFKPGVELERHYAQDIPKIMAYGSELNQVWTNLIDNAVDAMEGPGKIMINTKKSDDWISVEIIDSGSGIPKDVQQKLFSPFFTTKPMGKGIGLGLNISFNIIQKHKGDIRVFSRPGRTCFIVRLPINFEEVQQGSKPLAIADQPTDSHLREILESTKTIAVVGVSNRESVPAYTVPKYLMEKGYTIIPINPKYEQLLGEKAYPGLRSLGNPPDVVLVFRHSDFVPEIVEQAIEIGAKVVWLQEGIVNLEAAEAARYAGLDMVMNTCMRKAHQRLIK